jgi:8-oxo-dGTP pyrophosphatase MutT (NUDIX family)
MSNAEAAAMLQSPEAAGRSARAFLVGAAREVFEETGVLLGVDGRDLPDPGWLRSTRTRVHQGRQTFAEVLVAVGLRLRLQDLVPFARWVTPEALPKRYDTFFLAAPMPPNQEAVAAPGEIASLEWVTPADALTRADSKDAYTLPPTRAALTQLAHFGDVTSALAGVGIDAQLAAVLPRVVSRASGPGEQRISVLLPGEPGYEDQA